MNDPYTPPPEVVEAADDTNSSLLDSLAKWQSVRKLRRVLPPISAALATAMVTPVMYVDRGDQYVPFATSILIALVLMLCAVPLFYVLYRIRGIASQRSSVWTVIVLILCVPAAVIVFVPSCTMSFMFVASVTGQERALLSGVVPYAIGFWAVFSAISETIYGFLFAKRMKLN